MNRELWDASDLPRDGSRQRLGRLAGSAPAQSDGCSTRLGRGLEGDSPRHRSSQTAVGLDRLKGPANAGNDHAEQGAFIDAQCKPLRPREWKVGVPVAKKCVGLAGRTAGQGSR